MKILDKEQIRNWENYTLEQEEISSTELMERAGRQCSRWLSNQFDKSYRIVVVCGPGNNGGDGLVIARRLIQMQYKLDVLNVNFSGNFSKDFVINKNRLVKIGVIPFEINSKRDFSNIATEANTIIIDAVFGTGLTRAPDSLSGDCIDWINETRGIKIAIDIPSGMYCDINQINTHNQIVRADYTLSFECPKLSFMLSETGNNIGNLIIISIGLNKEFLSKTTSPYFYLQKNNIKGRIRRREKFSHKGTYGHCQIIAGSYGKMGAVILCARACLKAGTGLLTLVTPKCGLEILQTAVPEAMVDINAGENTLEGELLNKYGVIGIGPGIGLEANTKEFLKNVFEGEVQAMVIDADALNIISQEKQMMKDIPQNSIISPHPKEFERLVGKWKSEKEKIIKLLALSSSYKLYVILKGAHTIIATPEGKIYFNSTGNPGMATAGSGDVLTGILSSLLARRYSSLDSCLIAVYIHGLAGDIAATKISKESLLAGDIIEHISNAFEYLK